MCLSFIGNLIANVLIICEEQWIPNCVYFNLIIRHWTVLPMMYGFYVFSLITKEKEKSLFQ